jgi:hypothetical protein
MKFMLLTIATLPLLGSHPAAPHVTKPATTIPKPPPPKPAIVAPARPPAAQRLSLPKVVPPKPGVALRPVVKKTPSINGTTMKRKP